MDIGLLALFVVAGRWCLSFVVWLYPVLTTMVLITILHTIAEHQPDGYDGDPATLPARPVTRTTLPRALREVGGVPDQLRNPEGYDRRYFFRQGSWGSYYWPRHLNLFSPDGLDRLVRGAGLVPERRVDLLGPPCWVYTVMALNRSRARPLGWVEQFFTDTQPRGLGALRRARRARPARRPPDLEPEAHRPPRLTTTPALKRHRWSARSGP